jgi:hypothetical protein
LMPSRERGGDAAAHEGPARCKAIHRPESITLDGTNDKERRGACA